MTIRCIGGNHRSNLGAPHNVRKAKRDGPTRLARAPSLSPIGRADILAHRHGHLRLPLAALTDKLLPLSVKDATPPNCLSQRCAA